MDEEINDLKPTESIDSTNSNTPLQNKKKKSNQYIHAPKQDSLHDENNATMIINETDLEHIELDIEEEEEEHKQSTPPIEMIHSPSIVINHNIESNENEYSQTLSNETRDTRKSHSVDSITQRTDFSNKPKSPNPLDTTTLQHQGDDVQIGAGDHSPPFHNARMPSISYNNMDKELAALRRASRRKWWSPTRLCDWCMHKLIFGKIMVMILTWTTVIDYGKDLYVAYHFGLLSKWWEFSVTLCILFLSLRLMLYIRAIDDSHISFWKLLIFYLPGSVYADFQIDRFSDVGVCLSWEIAYYLVHHLYPSF
eukprot:929089_1